MLAQNQKYFLYVYREDFTPSLPLGLKGRFYASLAVLYLTATFYAWKVGIKCPCVIVTGKST